jgi:periplasmic divalent cation tolerance protein
MTDKTLVLSTTESIDQARRIAEALVDRRLAACVNIIPRITSIYRWKGKVRESEEWLLLIKTTTDAFEGLRAALKELHPYELPECIALAIDDGSEEYLKWISDSMK